MSEQPDPQQRYETLLRRFTLAAQWSLWLLALAAFAFAAPALLRLEFLRPIPLAVSILMLGSLGLMAANNPFGWWRAGAAAVVLLGVAAFALTIYAWVAINPEYVRVGAAIFVGALLAALLFANTTRNSKGMLLIVSMLVLLPGTLYFAKDWWSVRVRGEQLLQWGWLPVQLIVPVYSESPLVVLGSTRVVGGTMHLIIWDSEWEGREVPLPPSPGQTGDWILLGETAEGNLILSERFAPTTAPQSQALLRVSIEGEIQVIEDIPGLDVPQYIGRRLDARPYFSPSGTFRAAYYDDPEGENGEESVEANRTLYIRNMQEGTEGHFRHLDLDSATIWNETEGYLAGIIDSQPGLYHWRIDLETLDLEGQDIALPSSVEVYAPHQFGSYVRLADGSHHLIHPATGAVRRLECFSKVLS